MEGARKGHGMEGRVCALCPQLSTFSINYMGHPFNNSISENRIMYGVLKWMGVFLLVVLSEAIPGEQLCACTPRCTAGSMLRWLVPRTMAHDATCRPGGFLWHGGHPDPHPREAVGAGHRGVLRQLHFRKRGSRGTQALVAARE